MKVHDRIEELLKKSDLTGIDFIYVHPDQLTLDVYFLWDPNRHVPPPPSTSTLPVYGALPPEAVRIYSRDRNIADIPVVSTSWEVENSRDVLRIVVARYGDFSQFRIKLDDSHLDPFYNDVPFSFKANCPSDLDCAPPQHECPPEEMPDVQVNYLARDFWSFRQALLDFASLHYPHWVDRLEADAGIMLVEVMSALGDEMAYYQDRVAREAFLETASQRRSLRRHGQLVDYRLHDGLGASAWLNFTLSAGTSGNIAAGTSVWANSESGNRINFEVGRGIEETLAAKQYAVDAGMNENELPPHIWDDSEACLLLGAVDLFVENPNGITVQFDDQIEGEPGQIPGKWFLLKTIPTNPAQPARAHLVRVIVVEAVTDPITGDSLLHLHWEQDQALPFEMDMTVMTVSGNILPATAGERLFTYFIAGASFDDLSVPEQQALHVANDLRPVLPAVERVGPDQSITYLFTLPESKERPMTWLGVLPDRARPEIQLTEMRFDGANWIVKNSSWDWKASFVGVNSSQSEDYHYVLENGSWEQIVKYQRAGTEFIHRDYSSGEGVSIRFGNGEFGRIPAETSVFRVDYRLDGNRLSNVAANTLTNFSGGSALAFVQAVTNPLAATGGVDPETPSELRQAAPEAFRAITYRAVRPEDYAEAAERLPWVQRAGASFRWTGSWLSAFATPDPKGTSVLEEDRRLELVQQLDRFRQAGREAHVLKPVFANMDFEIEVCVAPEAYRGDVKERVLDMLLGKTGTLKKAGYFSADNFTFGTPLERSALEAAIQAISGVKAVEAIRFRRRGWFDWRSFDEMTYSPGTNAIIRMENDPLDPGKGTLKLYTHGGA